MGTAYKPGRLSKVYHRLPKVQRDSINKEVDIRFKEKTGVTRKLNPTSKADLELRRTWLRIRDEVMNLKEEEEDEKFRHEMDVSNLDLIPDEMRQMKWEEAARLLETWFERPPSVLPKYSAPVTDLIKMDWVLGFGRARSVYEDIFKDKIWTNDKGREQLAKVIKPRPASGATVNFGDLSRAVPVVDEQWVNARSVQNGLGWDGMAGALGSFQLKVAIAGKMLLTGTQDLTVTVEEVGVYVKDSFDFEGEQFLGFWGYRDTAVYNSDFREWRLAYQTGGDFLVFSDIKRTRLSKPDVVKVKL